jgi:hypothetical protein
MAKMSEKMFGLATIICYVMFVPQLNLLSFNIGANLLTWELIYWIELKLLKINKYHRG